MRQFYLAETQDGKRRRSLTANEYEISNRDRSPIKQLYMHGRFHASPVLMPNNDLVMSYVVRLGYDDTPEGLPQYGIEAVVSHDHGQTWNLDRRYVLDKWRGEWEDRPAGKVKLMAPNETYTVLLRDGSLITSFERGIQEAGVGYRRILKLVHWRLILQRHVSQWASFSDVRQRTYVRSVFPSFTHGAVVLSEGEKK